METVSPSTEPLTLDECKVRASLLLKALNSADSARATQAAERFRSLPALARLSLGEVLARRDSLQRKHALAVIAHEQGHTSWSELKHACDARAAPRVDFEQLLSRVGGLFLNRWFTSYEEAVASLRQDGGHLFPFREQFFICEDSLLKVMGAEPSDADWARMGPNWLEPRDAQAHARLEQRLLRLCREDASPSLHPTRKSPMSSAESSPPSGSRARRADLKREYKENPPAMGVYAVRNHANGKVLVGASLNVPGMLNRIRFELTSGMPRVPALLADWTRYGESQFTFDVLDVLEPPEEPGADLKEELLVLEKLWLERLKPYGDAGYNEPPK
ncbi:GIY-YIG nuclease family protein [Myxococcus landrumensis]|uniref:GIY-YIG nuclease family protein n=1 Tax=Myxococcus landrumensis TaxID=2813577 RepID=A0ABX7MZQ5_9BACT|nr:GIY-YIG nuclease family protein [Myxococcus landrumus]QSQ10972.1 GIY-YIG nuclease family protein [Myxococcus landrumus]